MLTERGMCSPGYPGTQAWSQRVMSSNPPRSLPGVDISPGLVCNLAAFVTVVGHTCQALITDRISFGVTLIPITWGWENAVGRRAGSSSVKFEVCEVSTFSSVKWVGTSTNGLSFLSGPGTMLSSVQNSDAHHGGGP